LNTESVDNYAFVIDIFIYLNELLLSHLGFTIEEIQ